MNIWREEMKKKSSPARGNMRDWFTAKDCEVSKAEMIIAPILIVALVLAACAVLSFCHIQGAW